MAKLIIVENSKLVVEVMKDKACSFCHEVVGLVYVSSRSEERDWTRQGICKDCARQIYETEK